MFKFYYKYLAYYCRLYKKLITRSSCKKLKKAPKSNLVNYKKSTYLRYSVNNLKKSSTDHCIRYALKKTTLRQAYTRGYCKKYLWIGTVLCVYLLACLTLAIFKPINMLNIEIALFLWQVTKNPPIENLKDTKTSQCIHNLTPTRDSLVFLVYYLVV